MLCLSLQLLITFCKAALKSFIAVAGGSEIQRECDDYMRQRDYRNLNPGLVYVSTSGRLPCKKVIHAVGPRWQGGNCSEEKNLYDAIYESLVAAEQCGLSSVALPALSSGNSGFPIDRCTMFITLALSDYLEGHKQTCVKKVFLVDKTDYVLKEFHKSLGIMYGMQCWYWSSVEQFNICTRKLYCFMTHPINNCEFMKLLYRILDST